MNRKIELLIKLTELSEQIRHSKKNHSDKNHHADIESALTVKHKHHRPPNKLSFTAKRTICILLDEQSINQRSISKRLGVSAQTVSEMIKNLEAKELIIKAQGELNNENIITLTDKGKEIATETNKRIAYTADRVFIGLSSEEIDTLGNILKKISENTWRDND